MTNRLPQGVEVSGASLTVVVAAGVAWLSPPPASPLALGKAGTAADLRRLDVAEEMTAPASPASSDPGAMAGTVRWRDPEENTHPVRGAFVQVLDGDTGSLLANTFTDLTGRYSAAATGHSVKVVVYTRDLDGDRVIVFPPGQPTLG